MKNIILSSITLLMGLTLVHAASASSWSVNLQSQGTENTFHVEIGIGETASKSRQPPDPPPPFDTMIRLLDINDLTTYYAKDVRISGKSRYRWILAIDPNGSAGGIEPAASTLTWEPANLGDGEFELRQGYQETGPVLVADMKTTAEYQLPQGSGETYYSIIFTPSQPYNALDPISDINGDGALDLTDAILTLQILSGMDPEGIYAEYEDGSMDETDDNLENKGDSKIGMEESIYILRKIAN